MTQHNGTIQHYSVILTVRFSEMNKNRCIFPRGFDYCGIHGEEMAMSLYKVVHDGLAVEALLWFPVGWLQTLASLPLLTP